MASDAKETESLFGVDLERTFRLTAEISTLLLICGFVLSTILNQLVFQQWELNFVTFADPTDVIMSGINLLFDVCVVTIFGFIVVLAIRRVNDFAAAYYEKVFPHSDNIEGNSLRTDYWLYISATIFVLFIAPIMTPIFRLFRVSNIYMGSVRMPFSLEAAHGIATFQVSFALLLILMLWKRLATFDEKERFWRSGAKLGMAISAFAALVGISSVISIRVDAGYQFRPLAIAGLPNATCETGRPLAFWVGSSHTIARCPGLWDEFVVPTESIALFEYSPAPSFCYSARGLILKCVIVGEISR